jgi:carbon monoxide dehydrogenase subunit G
MKKWTVRICGGVAGVLALTLVALALMGLRRGAGFSRSVIEIRATREQVWLWIEENDKFKEWVGWVTSVEVLNPEVKGVGRTTVVLMKEPGSPELVRVEAECTEYAPPGRFVADVTSPGLFTGSQSYELTDLGGGRTRVQIDNRIRYTPWFLRLLEPLATPSATKKLDQDLAALKRVVENAAVP